ncbi:MAG: ATP-binding cassette domain-containing protein [Sedimentisphaerales bacterium]|nr:ATP-binding cassette domain-containing protein [Sedimentisphaerales bacterium]
MIAAEHLTKIFNAGTAKQLCAVDDASFRVAPGEIFGLLGPNGAGKTTLLRMLGAILTPTSGVCAVEGIRTDENPEQARRQIGFLSGNTRLYKRLRAREVLRYFGRLYGMQEGKIEQRIATLAAMLEAEAVLERRCDALSTGETQKVSIARALLHEPQVLILDEPTLGLDIMTSRTILDFIRNAKERGHTIIFSTHTMTEAELLCDRIGLIHKGRILADGTKQQIYELTGTKNLQEAFLAMVEGGMRL